MLSCIADQSAVKYTYIDSNDVDFNAIVSDSSYVKELQIYTT